jgi:hypothetical protein
LCGAASQPSCRRDTAQPSFANAPFARVEQSGAASTVRNARRHREIAPAERRPFAMTACRPVVIANPGKAGEAIEGREHDASCPGLLRLRLEESGGVRRALLSASSREGACEKSIVSAGNQRIAGYRLEAGMAEAAKAKGAARTVRPIAETRAVDQLDTGERTMMLPTHGCRFAQAPS